MKKYHEKLCLHTINQKNTLLHPAKDLSNDIGREMLTTDVKLTTDLSTEQKKRKLSKFHTVQK